MKIIIPRIPNATTRKEMTSLVRELFAKKFHLPFTKHPRVAKCDIITITDQHGIGECHGFIVVHPEAAAIWLIKHLAGKRLHNKVIFARRYHDRGTIKHDKIPDGDRRRQLMQQENRSDLKMDVTGYDQFSQEHGQ